MRRLNKVLSWVFCVSAVAQQPLAHAAGLIYEIRGNTGGANSIWRIDPTQPSVAVAYANYPGGNAATLAQCPSGLIYYAINNTNGNIYRWDPASPATAPLALGAIGAGVAGSFRFACNTAGVLYYMPDSGDLYTISTATGAATHVAVITGAGSGGDMAFNATGTLYIINSSRQLFTASVAGGAAAAVGTVTGIANNSATLGLAFDASGNLYTESQNPTALYQIVGTTATQVIALLGDTGSTGDLASFIGLTSANITVAKAFVPTVIAPSGTTSLTITLSNANAQSLPAAAFIDTYPAGLVNSGTPSASTTCGGTVTAAAGSSSVALSGGTVPAAGSCTVSVSVTSSSAGIYTNTIAARSVTTAFANNDAAASATLTVKSPLTLTKTSAVYSDPLSGTTNPKRIPGAFIDYTIIVSNSAGAGVDNNTVIITDPLPANTALFVGDLGAAGSGPVAFANGAPASGLTYTFTSLASPADDVSFSSGGGTFNYAPTAGADGTDANVTQIRINPKGTFNPNSSFQIRLRVLIK